MYEKPMSKTEAYEMLQRCRNACAVIRRAIERGDLATVELYIVEASGTIGDVQAAVQEGAGIRGVS